MLEDQSTPEAEPETEEEEEEEDESESEIAWTERPIRMAELKDAIDRSGIV